MNVATWLQTIIPAPFDEARTALVTSLQVATVPAGHVLAYEGDVAMPLRWVTEGRVEAHKEASDGRQVLIHELSAPFVISGGPAHPGRQPMTLITSATATVVTLPALLYETWSLAYPEAALHLLGHVLHTVQRLWTAVTSRLADDLAFDGSQAVSA